MVALAAGVRWHHSFIGNESQGKDEEDDWEPILGPLESPSNGWLKSQNWHAEGTRRTSKVARCGQILMAMPLKSMHN
eukprot:CAMPEP_0206490576 /NCGR_PEP_ID=MMETSP0324_2-20121206/44221_1 /ASSEMBLY_ACC=CAM_ASM_000836 /TAXON_ID=2866 /ORGANISM="Crypthecodinium cohnii, Strain Seligo" /LENGTH=76 /DNA_ID=CAMNT_0053971079 /DNA_START=52 /DNA_END=282 /DNA_ORIENTATION=+